MSETINATAFKARCLEILDRLARRELSQVSVTKRGKVVAIMHPPPSLVEQVAGLHGVLRGLAVADPATDLTAPLPNTAFAAEQGVVHS